MGPMNYSLFSGLASVILVVALLGAALGIGISNTDLLNFNRSAAEAEAMRSATRVQNQKDLIDIQTHQRIKLAEATAIIEKISTDTQAYRQQVIQELRAQQHMNTVWLVTGPLAVVIIVIALGAFLVQLGRSQVLLAEAKVTRIKMIQAAREKEIAWRAAKMTKISSSSAKGGNGHKSVKVSYPGGR